MPTTSSSVRVDFYNGTVKNPDFFALLSDNRSNVTCSLSGSLTNVKDASLVIDLYEKTSAAKKPFTILPISSVTIEKGTTGRYTYAFSDLVEYSLKLMVVLNDGTNLTGKFSYGNVSDLTAYKFIYRDSPDAFSTAIFSKPNAVYTGSSIEVTAPMSFVTDARRPKRVRGSFDVLDQTSPTDDNSESLKSYCPEVDYSESGVYTFPSNTLPNDSSYSCTLEAIYDDGYKPWINVSGSANVFRGPIITAVEAFGLGVSNVGAGDPDKSSVMDVTMETETAVIFTGDNDITFTLSQGTKAYYTFKVTAKSGPNPVYNILNDSSLTILNVNPTQSTAANGSKYFAFNVTASRSYTSIYPIGGTKERIDKVSNIFPENFVLDMNRLGPILLDNQWTKLGLVAPSRKVVLDSTLTQQKWNLIPENGYLAKCFKNEFFGTGRNEGLFDDVDTTSTQFKFELSQDSGVTFSPVTSLRMKQGSVASSAAEDRAQWISLLGSTPLSNADGLFNNIPWTGPTKLLGPQQPPIYLMADCAAPASPTLIPGIFSLNGVWTKYNDLNMIGVKADSTLTVATIPDKNGWLIKNGANIVTTVNGVTTTTAPKVNLYYYVNTVPGYIPANPTAQPPTVAVESKQTVADSFTLNQATGLGLYAVFNQNSGAKQFPFFIVYTTQTGSGDKASWYKSNVFYAPASGNPLNSGITLAYSGTDNLSFRPDIPAERRVKYEVNLGSSNANADYASEFVKLLSFQTSGNATSTAPGDFNFQLLETGMFTSHASTGLVSLTYNEYSRSIPGIYSFNDVRTKYTDDNMVIVRADSTIPFATIQDKYGWLIKNGANITKIVNGVSKTNAPKVNLYYYVNTVSGYIPAFGETPSVASKQTSADSFTLSQASGLGLYAVFNQNSGAKQFPFFIAYTTQTGSGDKASWYKSNVFYAPASGNPLNSGITLAYSGTDNLSFRPDIPAERRVKYEVNLGSSNANADYASEFVKLLSFQTSGNATSTAPGDFNFQLLETGMFTSHASTGLVSLTYNEYSRLVLAVSVVASGATTRPTATQSNRIRLMNKVNTPTTGETASYNVPSSVLTVNVVNSDANDKMTGVLFTSNLKSPDDSAVVKNTAVINSFTFDRTGVTKDSISVLTDTECKFKIAYNVTDDNGGSDITGLQGPEITVPLRNLPSRVNYAISNFDYKTVNDHDQSSFSFGATFNSDNSANISGLKCYFNTTDDFSSSSAKVMVRDVKRSEGLSGGSDTVQSVVVRLDTFSNLSNFMNWADLSAGYVEFVPYFTPTTGSSDLEEVPAQQTRYGIYNVLKIASVPATLEGGVVEAATTLKWSGVSGSSYNLVGPGSSDLSAGIVASGTSFSSVFAANTLTAAVAMTLNLKKQQTLPQVAGTSSPLFITLVSKTWYGPVTDVTFTPVSVNTSSMAVTVARGSNNTQLLTSHVAATVSNSSLLNVTANQLTKMVGSVATPLTFSSGTGSSTLVQAHSVTNTHTLSGETLADILDLKMQVKAGVKYTSKVGSGTVSAPLNSDSVVLPLGPLTPYRVAMAPSVTSGYSKYTVNGGRVEIAVSINSNGLAAEGLATVVAFISQESSLPVSGNPQAGVGGTALTVFGPGSTRSYTVGANASASSTTDNLAPGESVTTTPEDLKTSAGAIESGSFTLTLGSLTGTDASVLSFPTTGFNTTAPIAIILIVTTRLGHNLLSTILTYQAPL